MFMHVINGYFSTIKVIQGYNFGLRSYQGQTKSEKRVFWLYTIHMANIKMINPTVIEILLERINFKVLLQI